MYSKTQTGNWQVARTIKQWLASQDAYILHAPVRNTFPRKQYFVSVPNDLLLIDLANMQNVAKYNDGHRFILCSIDVFLRYATCILVKNKTGAMVAEAITAILKTLKLPLTHCQTDLGMEFYNQHVKQVFDKYKVNN